MSASEERGPQGARQAPVTAGTATFERIAAVSAALVALGALAYTGIFVLLVGGTKGLENRLWFLVLMVGAIATTPVLVAVYQRLRRFDAALALIALLLG